MCSNESSIDRGFVESVLQDYITKLYRRAGSPRFFDICVKELNVNHVESKEILTETQAALSIQDDGTIETEEVIIHVMINDLTKDNTPTIADIRCETQI